MKKIKRLRRAIIAFFFLYAFAQVSAHNLGIRYGTFPLSSWKLGFENRSLVSEIYEILIQKADGVEFDPPLTLRHFAESNDLHWHVWGDYKYAINLAASLGTPRGEQVKSQIEKVFFNPARGKKIQSVSYQVVLNQVNHLKAVQGIHPNKTQKVLQSYEYNKNN